MMASDQGPAAFEPVIVQDAVFHIDRLLESSGELAVRVSDRVEPGSEIATAMVASGRPLMLNIARELDIEPDAVERYLTKPVGSSFGEGEPLARSRRGLRSVTCSAPASATLTTLDPSTGVATLVPQSYPQKLHAAVHGEIESIVDNRGVVIRSIGSRVQGFLGLGQDTYGQLKVAVDRADRELTADMIVPDFRDCIVLGGMTLGTSALRRLVEVGARGVVVGSISDGEVRRFLSSADGEPSSMLVWRRRSRELDPQQGRGGQGLTVFVTEGFGRRRMAQPVYQFLSGQEDQLASLIVPDGPDVLASRPTLYLTSDRSVGDDAIQRVHVRDGTLARLVDPEHLGIVVTCRSQVMDDPCRAGLAREVVDVEFSNGNRSLVPALSLEVLVP